MSDTRIPGPPDSIIDTHVHLWDPGVLDYPWLDGIPLLNRPHLLGDFYIEREGIRVQKMVFVECTGAMTDESSRREVDWVHSIASEEARISGIVAHASLEIGEAASDHLTWLASQPLVKGVRRLIQGEQEADFCLQPGFVEGVRLLALHDFSFDACIYHHQMPSLIRLVDRCPGVQFVLDHLGKPAIREGQLDPWRSHLRELASLPNVVCKISGALTEADHEAWTAEEVIPFLEYAIEQFGADRIMFGGDWPVIRLAGTWPVWVDLVLAASGRLSPDDQEKFFCTNAERIYRMGG